MKTLALLFLLTLTIYSQNSGNITGIITDKETQKPLPEATVTLIETGYSIGSDANGKFEFTSVPYGTYQVRVSKLGYESIVKTDVVLLSSRPTNVIIELNITSITTETIDVEAKYFEKSSSENTSTFNLDFEEVRRAPGAVEDISRMLQILPGVAPANDQRNDLIVRGGSPAENLVIIDGIEIPNINHYPTQGSTSGPIGMINVKFVNDVNFTTGGFSARYGDKLSSVMDLSFREGYRKTFLSDINLSSAGFGGVFEGPLFSKKGSFLFSARKSFLNLIRGAIRLSAIPDYWDFNLKAVYDINKNTKLSLIGIAGIDNISFEGTSDGISDDNPYGKAKGNQKQFTVGLNLKRLFKKGYLQLTAANSSGWTYIENRNLNTDEMKFNYDSYESDFNAKAEIFWQMNSSNNLIFGIGGKTVDSKTKTFYVADTSAFGYILPETNVNVRARYYKASAYTQYTLKAFEDKLILNAGLRYDYFSGINDKNVVSPRFGASYKITSVTTFNLAAGIYHQSPEYIWLSSDPANVNLKFMRAYHYVAGIEHLFAYDLRFSIEGYYKKYENYPVSVLVPTYVLIAGGTENGPNLLLGPAVSKAFGFTRGIDLSLQKKLTGSGFYGMLNYSLTESKVTALEGGERPGSFDYRHNMTLIAGYQVSNDWLVSMKLRYTTGRPYTPFDNAASTFAGRGVYNFSDFNGARFKDYSRLDIRVDKKWNFKKLTIVSYIELQNIFNKENVYSYFWNEYKNKEGTIYQWAFLPVGGFSIQF